jgi:hypothetical protein
LDDTKALKGLRMLYIRVLLIIFILICCQESYANEINPLISGFRDATYIGSINGKYKITMVLRIYDNVEIGGTYKYDKNGVDIPLKGSIDKSRNCKIEEFAQNKKITKDNSKNEPTAYFEGHFDQTNSLFEGEWKSRDGKSFPFSLRLQHSFIDNSSSNRKKFRTTLSFIDKLNITKSTKTKLRTLLTRQINDDTREVSIEYKSNNLLSILYIEELPGAAHSYTAYNSYNVSIVGENITELYYVDLFAKGSNYLNILSDYCITVLRKQDRLIDSNLKKIDYDELTNFIITSKGLVVYFTPLNVAIATEDYDTSVLIPYKDLESIIDRKGPLAVFLSSTERK